VELVASAPVILSGSDGMALLFPPQEILWLAIRILAAIPGGANPF